MTKRTLFPHFLLTHECWLSHQQFLNPRHTRIYIPVTLVPSILCMILFAAFGWLCSHQPKTKVHSIMCFHWNLCFVYVFVYIICIYNVYCFCSYRTMANAALDNSIREMIGRTMRVAMCVTMGGFNYTRIIFEHLLEYRSSLSNLIEFGCANKR